MKEKIESVTIYGNIEDVNDNSSKQFNGATCLVTLKLIIVPVI